MIYMKVFWFAKDLIRIDYQGQVHDVDGAAYWETLTQELRAAPSIYVRHSASVLL